VTVPSATPPSRRPEPRADLLAKIGAKETRKVRARRETHRGIWFGLGMFGVVGWAVAIPTLIGIVVGIWLDRAYPARHSWTLTLLVLGIALGCLNAWLWVSRERSAIARGEEDSGDE